MIRIAVDGMGGDFAPQAIVEGAESAANEGIAEVVLVGDETLMKPYIHNTKGLEIVHTPVYVAMDESPSTALRKKRDSSINKAFELHKSGDVQAVVSAGNSGATMAFATFTLGRIAGVDRPAIAVLHPSESDRLSILLDAAVLWIVNRPISSSLRLWEKPLPVWSRGLMPHGLVFSQMAPKKQREMS